MTNKKTNKYLIVLLSLLFSSSLMAIHVDIDQRDAHLSWRKKVRFESKDAYYIGKDSVVADLRQDMVNGYNYIVSNNGYYKPHVVKNAYGCDILQGWSIAKIIETKEGSNVVKIRYIKPYTDMFVVDKYVVTSMIHSLPEYTKNMAR